MHPLTHHEIVGLVGAFAHRGRHVDLAASDRMARKLVFRAVDHATTSPTCRELLELDSATPGVHRLVRTLVAADDVQSMLVVEGPDPDALLARAERVPHAMQLQIVSTLTIAHSFRLTADDVPVFTHATVRIADLTARLDRGDAGDRHALLTLSTPLDEPLDLPDDLVAVLGWAWSRLDGWADRSVRRWTASVRLRGRGIAAGQDAQRQFARVATLLATTLAEAPARFHERHRAARWLFAFRRSIPLQVCLYLILGALLFRKAGLSQDSGIRMLIFNAPPLMLVAFFCLREPPRIEWPTWPRRVRNETWRDRVAG